MPLNPQRRDRRIRERERERDDDDERRTESSGASEIIEQAAATCGNTFAITRFT